MTSFSDLCQCLVSTFQNEDMEDFAILLVLIAGWLVVPAWSLYKGIKTARLVMLMRCLPTSKARGVFIGLSEVKGEALRTPPLTSYLAEQTCAWYNYTVEEHWRRVETRVCTDSKGRVRIRRVVREGWTEVDSGTSTESFHLQDDTGSVLVWPEGATVEGMPFLQHTCRPEDPMYYGKGPSYAIPDSTHKRRFVEWGIPIRAQLYIIGTTREQDDGIHPAFAEADNNDPYLISMKDEERLTHDNGLKAKLLPVLGICVLLLPSFMEDCGFPRCFYNPDFSFAEQSIWLHTALIYTVLWLAWTFWQWYGEMVAARNRVAQGIAQVEVQLQRRHDLILRLVDVVDAYCRHEQSLLEQIAELRAQVKQGQVSLLAEAYPDLKAQPLFAKLHQELTDTEERMALAREYLNTIGNFYNTCLQVFPGGLILKLFRFPTFHNYE